MGKGTPQSLSDLRRSSWKLGEADPAGNSGQSSGKDRAMHDKCSTEVHRGPRFLLGTGYVRAQLLQLCPTLCNPLDHRPPGFFVHGVFQARILEWVAVFLLQWIFPTQGCAYCIAGGFFTC